MFQTINDEKYELIHFETLISEISVQEGISFSDTCAVIARQAAWHLEDIPLTEPFFLYDYDVINGFIKRDDFSNQSIAFLKSMALGADYAEDADPEFKGIYSRTDGVAGWYREFYFKGTEITISFLDYGVTLPPCLDKFRSRAEKWIAAKAVRLEQEKMKLNNKEPSKDELKKEIERLKTDVEKLSTLVPCMLGEFRGDDPLMIAIKLRNSEWLNYNPDDRKTIPSQEGLVAQIKQQYKEFDMPDVQARSIEKVACPIRRK